MRDFILTRSLKPASGIKRILVRCPTTGKLAPTGRTVDEALWEKTKLKPARLTCPHCHQVHNWKKADVVLARELRSDR
ncbi:MAG: hypothetical protein QOG67_75 [Verrucomicrobiota bacterium]|jgi:hypothetical protein